MLLGRYSVINSEIGERSFMKANFLKGKPVLGRAEDVLIKVIHLLRLS